MFFQVASATATRYGLSRGLLGLKYDQINYSDSDSDSDLPHDYHAVLEHWKFFIERPSDLKARVQTYSTYKSQNTMKFLIGITPQGSISFISKGWGGGAYG